MLWVWWTACELLCLRIVLLLGGIAGVVVGAGELLLWCDVLLIVCVVCVFVVFCGWAVACDLVVGLDLWVCSL